MTVKADSQKTAHSLLTAELLDFYQLGRLLAAVIDSKLTTRTPAVADRAASFARSQRSPRLSPWPRVSRAAGAA